MNASETPAELVEGTLDQILYINEDSGSTHVEELAQRVLALGADLGLAFDGDADRALFVADTGRIVNGDGTDDHAFHLKIFYGLTPSTETSVYDFWALSRDFCVGDEAIDSALEKMQIGVVQEDVDALNIIQQRVNAGRELTEVSVKIDRG